MIKKGPIMIVEKSSPFSAWLMTMSRGTTVFAQKKPEGCCALYEQSHWCVISFLFDDIYHDMPCRHPQSKHRLLLYFYQHFKKCIGILFLRSAVMIMSTFSPPDLLSKAYLCVTSSFIIYCLLNSIWLLRLTAIFTVQTGF